MMSAGVWVHGFGAVSVAGFERGDLLRVCEAGEVLETERLEHPSGEGEGVACRRIDAAALKKSLPKHPRLRRAGLVSKLAMAAAAQAVPGEDLEKISAGELRLGVVGSFFNGGVGYSKRFFGEVLENPQFASPILFPETVFNATPSHVATCLGADGPSYTLLGDSATWFTAMTVAQEWLADGLVDACLVICSEELDSLSAAGLALHSTDFIATEGGAAVYLKAEPSSLALTHLHGPLSYGSGKERAEALRRLAENLENQNRLVVDGCTGVTKFDACEEELFADWSGKRLSPTKLLGEGMGVKAGLQTILALEALEAGEECAAVFAGGENQQAYVAQFERSN